MKKLIAIVLLLCMALSLCACGVTEAPAATEAPATEAPAVETTEAAPEVEIEVPDGMVTYTVTVVDEAGSPVAGAMVQLCKDNCYPNVTDANGEAFFELAEDSYKVSFLMLPAGYTYSTDAQEFYFENGASELTIVLKATE